MKEGKTAITRVFTSASDDASRRRILGNAEKVIEDIQQYQRDINKSETATKAQSDDVLEQILKTLGQWSFLFIRIFYNFFTTLFDPYLSLTDE